MAVMRRVLVVAFLALAACGLGTVSAEDQSLLNRCWTPQALAGTHQELQSVRSHFHLDLAPLKQEPLPQASPVPQELRGSIRSVTLPPGEKLIALTFDLCETNGDVAAADLNPLLHYLSDGQAEGRPPLPPVETLQVTAVQGGRPEVLLVELHVLVTALMGTPITGPGWRRKRARNCLR